MPHLEKRRYFFVADSKLIANFAGRTLKNMENGKDNSPKYGDNRIHNPNFKVVEFDHLR